MNDFELKLKYLKIVDFVVSNECMVCPTVCMLVECRLNEWCIDCSLNVVNE